MMFYRQGCTYCMTPDVTCNSSAPTVTCRAGQRTIASVTTCVIKWQDRGPVDQGGMELTAQYQHSRNVQPTSPHHHDLVSLLYLHLYRRDLSETARWTCNQTRSSVGALQPEQPPFNFNTLRYRMGGLNFIGMPRILPESIQFIAIMMLWL